MKSPDAAPPKDDNHHPSHDFHSSSESDGVCTECGADCDIDKARQPCAPPPSDAAPVAPSDEAKLAFVKAHTAVMGEWEVTDGWEEALDAGLRAVYAIDGPPPSDAVPVSDTLREALLAHENKVVDMTLACGEKLEHVYRMTAIVRKSREALLALATQKEG